MPSPPYRLGQGFYSDPCARTQVQAAANAGRIKNLARFLTTAGSSGSYSQDVADLNLIFPAIKAKLEELGANVAGNVVADERWFDFVLGLLVLPAMMACSNGTISGEGLLRHEGAMKTNQLEGMIHISKKDEPSMCLRFRK